MPCITISDANPDIAGIGVVLAFGLQALVSLVLSIVAKYLEKPRNLNDFLRLGAENLSILATFRRVLDGIDLNDSPTTITKKVVVQIKEDFKDTILPAAQKHDQHGQGRIVTDDVGERATSIAQNIASRIVEQIKDNLKASVKSTISKTRKEIGDVIDTFFEGEAEEGKVHLEAVALPSKEVTRYRKKQQSICSILLTASDAQTITGIALIISAMTQRGSLSIYHMHLIYDTINFTAVSNFAAICCAYDNHLEGQHVRYISIGVFAVLYTAFAIIFGIRLNEWNDELPGRCFNASKIALPNARHPAVDQIYLGVTSFYVFGLLIVATVYCRAESLRAESQKSVLVVGLIQFILHVYMVIALRVSNQSLLNDASLEEEWGFGQVLALVMFGSTLIECAKSWEEYYSGSKDNDNRGDIE